jgi:hypothetical protein
MRKKTLSEILRLFRPGPLSPHETINRSPVRAAKFLESLLCRGCWTLRFQHYAPMRGGKRRAAIGASANRGQRRHIVGSGGLCRNTQILAGFWAFWKYPGLGTNTIDRRCAFLLREEKERFLCRTPINAA